MWGGEPDACLFIAHAFAGLLQLHRCSKEDGLRHRLHYRILCADCGVKKEGAKRDKEFLFECLSEMFYFEITVAVSCEIARGRFDQGEERVIPRKLRKGFPHGEKVTYPREW